MSDHAPSTKRVASRIADALVLALLVGLPAAMALSRCASAPTLRDQIGDLAARVCAEHDSLPACAEKVRAAATGDPNDHPNPAR